MEQSNRIIRNSQLFLVLIMGSLLLMAAFFIMYRNSAQQDYLKNISLSGQHILLALDIPAMMREIK